MIILEFKGYFLEMQTSDNEKNLIREIISNLISYNKPWFDEKCILVGDKTNYWILNYSNFGKNEYNRLVRGMVIKKPTMPFHGDPLTLISSFPFTRFHNQGENEASHVDMMNSDMIEKLDGTMVAVHFPNHNPNDPYFHTRKMHSSHEPDMKLTQTSFLGLKNEFMPTIKKYVDKLKFDENDTLNTYVFEFIHEISHVVTKYNPSQYGLYLLGARNIKTHKEYSEEELNKIAYRIGAKRPRLFDATNNQDEIEKMFILASEETPDFEGFVFRDKNSGNRIKVKDAKYVRIHHILDKTKISSLVPIIFLGEDEEVAAYFPHARENIKLIKNAINQYVEEMTNKVLHYKSLNLSKKDLSKMFYGEDVLPKWERKGKERIKPEVEETRFNSSLILSLISISDKKEIETKLMLRLKELALGKGNNDGNPKKLMEIINLKDHIEKNDEE